MILTLSVILVCISIFAGYLRVYSPGKAISFLEVSGKPLPGSISEIIRVNINGVLTDFQVNTYLYKGSARVKVLPINNSDLTVIFPLCKVIILSTSDNPIPCPLVPIAFFAR